MGKFRARVGYLIVSVALVFSCDRSALAVSSAVNISTRLQVGTGDNVGIGGFIVTGHAPKKVLIRALGPALTAFGLTGVLPDPTMSLFDGTGAMIAANDNWKSTQQTEITATGLQPPNDLESTLIVTLAPGNYTVVVAGTNNSTGIALIEIYDLDTSNGSVRLGNISTRGNVHGGDDVMIGGFAVRGDISKRVVVRVTGPSLGAFGIPFSSLLFDPRVDLVDSGGHILASNDNWRSTQETDLQATPYAPHDDHEPAILISLAPGNYTAVVHGVGNSTGLALIEVYDLDQPPQADGSTLYVAQLRAQAPGTSASGTATIKLSADGTSAILNFTYSNLSSPLTGMHVHGPNGEILFDVDAATPQADGSYLWVIQPVGTLTVADIANDIRTGNTYFNVHTANNPKGEIKGYFVLSSGGQSAPTPTPAPPLASGPPTAEDASRFLTQATFGATQDDINHLQQVGFDAWLNEQFATPASSHVTFVDNATTDPSLDDTMAAWWTYAISAPDQLRQRVAFALSEILVVSANGAGLDGEPIALSTYYDLLINDSFGNFRQILQDVTLNPAMGAYLNMLQNDRVDPDSGEHPNENYAREIMQLFSIGLYRLNFDGSLTLDANGFPIPTYNQTAVSGLAAVFTGWTFNGATDFYNGPEDYRNPMQVWPDHHQAEGKIILDNTIVPADQPPAQDLQQSLDKIFQHPNVGPFICRQLIQRLVTSNPSPGYIYRVASVFNNNGQGVRGDMRAVIRAILMDYDARGTTKTGLGSGKQREPLIRLTNLLRTFHAFTNSGAFYVWLDQDSFGEVPLQSPTVFNFFTPDYSVPGAIAQNGLRSPEFQITTETTVVEQANDIYSAIYEADYPLNLDLEISLANNPAALTDHLNALLMSGNMSPEMRQVLIDTITAIPTDNPEERAQTALYLVMNSPEYVIQK